MPRRRGNARRLWIINLGGGQDGRFDALQVILDPTTPMVILKEIATLEWAATIYMPIKTFAAVDTINIRFFSRRNKLLLPPSLIHLIDQNACSFTRGVGHRNPYLGSD